MCGILGYFHKATGTDHQLGATMLSMLEALGRRGPDSAGVALVGPAHQAAYIVRVQAGDELEMSDFSTARQYRTSSGHWTAPPISPPAASMCVLCSPATSTCPR
jgi:glutamate synthase domain-containing protein 1